jgi:predicted GIY-YIG superfamily endonuclease
MSQPFWAYMLRCADDAFYVGHTDDLEHRLAEHSDGRYCRFTQSRRPVELVWSASFHDRDEAKAAEAKLKGWSRAKKQALIDGDFEQLSGLAGRGARSRALRDGLRPPQGRGSRNR